MENPESEMYNLILVIPLLLALQSAKIQFIGKVLLFMFYIIYIILFIILHPWHFFYLQTSLWDALTYDKNPVKAC